MNKVFLIARIVRDPDIRRTQEGTAIARYTLAVDRGRRKEDGSSEADFISCVAFGRQAEFAEKYLSKGMKIAVEGRIQTGSYTDRDGTKRYTTDVVVDRHEFCERRSGTAQTAPPREEAPDSDFVDVPDLDDLPFR